MKKYICLVVFLLSGSVNVFSQQQVDKVWEVMKLTRSREAVESITKVYLDKFQKDYPKVPKEKWTQIAQSINHTQFLNSLHDVYQSQYSIFEIDAMLTALKAGDQNKFTQLSQKTERQIYAMSKSYGNSLSQMIFAKIK